MITRDDIRSHYDSLAFIYRNFWGDHIHHGRFRDPSDTPEAAQVELVDHCVRLLDPLPGNRVLDVGCGHAGPAVRLAAFHGFEVVGITLSPKQAQYARRNAEKARSSTLVEIFVEDAEAYPYPPAAFDLVWTMEASEHFFDKPAYLRNVSRTLRAGGKLLLAAWTGSMQRPLVRQVAERFLCPELLTAGEYQQLAERAGLRVLVREDLTSQVVRTWEVCLQRADSASFMLAMAPQPVRDFVAAIPVILEAYRSGDLRYSILVARKDP